MGLKVGEPPTPLPILPPVSRDPHNLARGIRLRNALIAGFVFSALVLLCLMATSRTPVASALPQQPNVVMVMVDDATLSDYMSRPRGKWLMPRTHSLIENKGVRFTRAYSSYPLSCPSRTTFLSGQYAHNHEVLSNVRHPNGDETIYCSDPEFDVKYNTTLPAWLQAEGYRTIHTGRFLNGFPAVSQTEIPAGWNEWFSPVFRSNYPSANFYGYVMNENGALTEPFGHYMQIDHTNYFTDVIHGWANDQIDAAVGAGDPFFTVIDERAPHEDSSLPVGPQPALRHIGSPTEPPPKNAATDERDTSDKPYYIRAGGRITSPATKKELRVRNKRRQESLRAVDEGIGHLIDNLDAQGVLDNTYILFASDNGFFRGEHEISKGKGRHYEPATHIPMLIRGPGLKRGAVNHSPVANVDLAATIADITNSSPTRTLDGRSLIPLAQHPDRVWNRPILLEEFFRKKGRPIRSIVGASGSKTTRMPNHQAIISGWWKLVRYVTGELELYNLKMDPNEVWSVHREPEAMGLRKYLLRKLAKLDMCRGTACRQQFVIPRRLSAGGLKAIERVSRKGRP